MQVKMTKAFPMRCCYRWLGSIKGPSGRTFKKLKVTFTIKKLILNMFE